MAVCDCVCLYVCVNYVYVYLCMCLYSCVCVCMCGYNRLFCLYVCMCVKPASERVRYKFLTIFSMPNYVKSVMCACVLVIAYAETNLEMTMSACRLEGISLNKHFF